MCSTQEDVEKAVLSAHKVFKEGIWSKAPAIHRATVLSNLARDLEDRLPDLAKMETLQTGRPIREMNDQVRRFGLRCGSKCDGVINFSWS